MSETSAILHVRVTPRSSRSEVSGVRDGVLQVRVHAAPVEGEANKAVIELLAKTLGVPRSCISVKSGASGRQKTLVVSGLSQQSLDQCLASLPRV